MNRHLEGLASLSVFLFLAAGSLPTDELSTANSPAAPVGEERCPEGTSLVMYWQGEYPGPVVHVQDPVVLQGSEAPCQSTTRACQVEPGLYHPWGDGRGFATVVPIQRYRATRSHALESWDGPSVVVEPGQEVAITGYLGEGNCDVVLPDGSKVTGVWCPGNDDGWQEQPAPAFKEQQYALVPCQGGSPAWVVVDSTLFNREQIAEGVITGWGEVGPEGAEGIW